MTDTKTDAWMPLWIGAYLADTMNLTTLQHGAYLLLLMSYWRDRAPLQDDDDTLRSITKTDRSEWKKIRPVLARFFKVEDGVWWHKRVELEMAAADQRQKAASSKARIAAEKRWNKQPSSPPSNAPSMLQALPEDMLKECPTPSPTPCIGIPTLVAKELSVCVPESHTPISDEFKTAIQQSRPDLDASLVYRNFTEHYPPDKQTIAKWRQWFGREHVPTTPVAPTPAPKGKDPELLRLEREAEKAVPVPAAIREFAARLPGRAAA